MYPRLRIHLSLYLGEYTDSDMHKCMYTYAYLCVYSRAFDGYFLGRMTNLYAQFTEFYTGISKETLNVYYGIEKNWPFDSSHLIRRYTMEF